MASTEVKTLVIDKWNGRLTRFANGDANSGMANYLTTWGTDTFNNAGSLMFYQTPVDITKSVITDLIMSAKVRTENIGGNIVSFVYAIGHTGRLYKIQVNDPVGKNPDYDTPVLLATLANAQTFLYAGSLDFYQGASEKIWIGHDAGITKINLDGTGETNLIGGSWQTNVPRQQLQFAGSIYFTNGNNLAKVDSTETVTSYAVLSPGFPSNSQARSLGTTVDGRYLVTVVCRNSLGNMTSTSPDIAQIAAMPSSLVYWNGVDTAPTASTSFPAFSLTNYYNFAQAEYVFGFQIGGAQLSTVNELVYLLEFENPPLANAVASSGDFLGWAGTFWDVNTGNLKAIIDLYGILDPYNEVPKGLYRQLIMSSTLSGGDIIRIPLFMGVSSFQLCGLTSGYTNVSGLFGTGKSYFSTLEYNGTTTKYGFYMFKNVNDFLSASVGGVYETQHQLFSKKVKATEYRVYFSLDTLVPGASGATSFKIDLIGLDGNVISGTTKTFTPLTADGDRVQYNPSHAPSSALGVRVTNLGAISPIIHKVEIDYEQMGK